MNQKVHHWKSFRVRQTGFRFVFGRKLQLEIFSPSTFNEMRYRFCLRNTENASKNRNSEADFRGGPAWLEVSKVQPESYCCELGFSLLSLNIEQFKAESWKLHFIQIRHRLSISKRSIIFHGRHSNSFLGTCKNFHLASHCCSAASIIFKILSRLSSSFAFSMIDWSCFMSAKLSRRAATETTDV